MNIFTHKISINWLNVSKPFCLFKKPLALLAPAALALCVAFTGCSGSDKNEVYSSSANSVFVSNGDVYVAGQKYDSSQGKYVAVVWKNGVAQCLDTQFESSIAASVFVHGGDVYVAGIQANLLLSSLTTGTPTLWKNGTPQLINAPFGVISTARSVFVSNGDVYVAGALFDVYGTRAVVLKNGEPLPMDFSNDYSVIGSSVYVSDGDVYVVGTRTSSGKSIAMLWKNGAAQDLSIDNYYANNTVDTYATSVFVTNGEVYVAGCVNQFPYDFWPTSVLWKKKNDRTVAYKFGAFSAETNSVFFANDTVYIAGNTHTNGTMTRGGIFATLWSSKDEILSPYIPSSTFICKNESVANSLFVSGGDVYVAGEELINVKLTSKGLAWEATAAKLWKNGAAIDLR
jgi:hypothetical protein